MVAPVSGPIVKTMTTALHYHDRRCYKQAKPIDRPLPFTGSFGDVQFMVGQQGFFVPIANAVSFMGAAGVIPSNLINAAIQAAYERFRGSISDKAQMGVFLAELEQACGMIATRGKQIADLIIAAKKLDFGGMSKILRRDFKPKNTSKGFAGIWLECSFGWVPMISDIYAAVDVLQNPIKSLKPGGSAMGGHYDSSVTDGSFPNEASRTVRACTVHAKVGAEVTVTNPNLYLANNLGLVNPGTIAWELIPFSFVVDWFIPVENFLSFGSDLYGLGVTNAWYTIYNKGTVYDYQKSVELGRYGERYIWGGYMNRILGLPGPSLFVRPFKIPSWKRAGNAISLVVQLLGGR